MTPESVQATVERIRQIAGDDEVAHCREDDLYISVLTAIAEGKCPDPQGCAREALKAQDIEFSRWCA